MLLPITIGAMVWLYTAVPQTALTLAAIGGLGLLAFIFTTSALTGTCGIYTALGIATCDCDAEYEGTTWG